MPRVTEGTPPPGCANALAPESVAAAPEEVPPVVGVVPVGDPGTAGLSAVVVAGLSVPVVFRPDWSSCVPVTLPPLAAVVPARVVALAFAEPKALPFTPALGAAAVRTELSLFNVG
jgi:hypothetical protein